MQPCAENACGHGSCRAGKCVCDWGYLKPACADPFYVNYTTLWDVFQILVASLQGIILVLTLIGLVSRQKLKSTAVARPAATYGDPSRNLNPRDVAYGLNIAAICIRLVWIVDPVSLRGARRRCVCTLLAKVQLTPCLLDPRRHLSDCTFELCATAIFASALACGVHPDWYRVVLRRPLVRSVT